MIPVAPRPPVESPLLLSVDEALEAITGVRVPIEQARLSERARRAARVTLTVIALLVLASLAASVIPALVAAFDRARAAENDKQARPAPGAPGNGWRR